MNFSLKTASRKWKAYSFDTFFPFYKIEASDSTITELKNFVNGIQADTYVIVAQMKDSVVLCMKPMKKGSQTLIKAVNEDEFYKIINVLRKGNFVTDELSAWAAIDSCVELLKSGSERYFINRGLFSTYFLRERLDKALSERKRNVSKEIDSFISRLPMGLPIRPNSAKNILTALGYTTNFVEKDNEFILKSQFGNVNASAIIVEAENLDVKPDDGKPVPSVHAVASLSRHPWVLLTNGKAWRLYSSRVSSASTNYFEVYVDEIEDKSDPRLKYFISLFSSYALVLKQDEIADVDYVFDGGQTYALQLEEDLRKKVFEKELFLDLVRGILKHSRSKKYSEKQLEEAKRKALKLLYRLLFILYAESRQLFPLHHSVYKDISIGSIRERINAMEKDKDSTSVWDSLKTLFNSISK